MSNSQLVSYTKISPHKTINRNHTIDTITIHCIVAQWTAKQGCDYFATTGAKCSANYVVGKDGSIGLSVEEKDRSWCTSSSVNDNRAVTIEVASDSTHPYAVTDKAFEALIDLVADICKRNGIKKLVWSTNKSDRLNHTNGCNMTVHRDYANKACPGEYLYSRHGYIAEQVNKKLGSNTITVTQPVQSNNTTSKIDTVKEVQTWLNNFYSSGLVVDGEYGPKTKAALVKVLQKAIGVTVDGEYGNQTNGAIKNLKNGSTGEAVKALQGLLVCNGYTSAYVDGDYGAGTQDAVKAYQKKKGLYVDGIAGKATFSALCR